MGESSLEEKVSKAKPKKIVNLLYLADLGFGTKAYDGRIMDGLAVFLKYNSLGKDIDSVFIEGGLIPFLPPYSSKQNSIDMRMLGTLSTKKGKLKEEYYQLITSVDPDEAKRNKRYYDEVVEKKIVNRKEAAEFAKIELSKLVGVLKNNVEFHTQLGVGERKNIDYDREIMITNINRQKKDLEKHEKNLEAIANEINAKSNYLEMLVAEKKILKYIKDRATALKVTKEGDELKEYFNGLIGRIEKNGYFKKFSEDEKQRIKDDILSYKNIGDFNDVLYKPLGDEIKNLNKELKSLKDSYKEKDFDIQSIHTIWRSLGFSRIIKRVHVEADDEEIYYRKAKNQNNEFLYMASPDEFRKRFHVHSSREKIITLTDDSKKHDAVYIPNIRKIRDDDITIMMVHNINFLSDSPTFQEIKSQKLEAHFLNKISLGIPDIILSAHGRGGFRVMPEEKYSENTVAGEERKTPEILMHFKLPTLQSIEKLQYLKSKNIKTWDTKRYSQKLYASGIVLHSIRDDGVHEVSYIDSGELIKFAEIEKEIRKVNGVLKRKDITEIKRKERIKEHRDSINSIKINTKKIEISGDTHIGCPNELGRPSNYEFEEASQKYQMKHGFPNILVASEYAHGSLERVFESDKQYLGKVPTEFENNLEKIILNNELSDKEKIEIMKKYSIKDKSQIPLTRVSQQLYEIKLKIVPYLEKVLENDGRVVLVSGNHFNKTTKNFDEAESIANMISNSSEYLRNKQLILGVGPGEKFGSVSVRIDGDKKLYSAHEPKKGQDEILGAMKQMLDANIDADIAVFFHTHHGGGGFADGTFYIGAFGKQPWNKYVDMIGKSPGLRGIVNFYYDPTKKFGKWEFVLDPTLEKYM